VVGERYGFRIESGRGGPRGNERVARLMARLASIDATDPLDHVLVTGDMTDAGRATEWAEFLDAISQHPNLAARMIVLPGNHDVNIVDRANPARLDLPFSPGKRLRQMRTLSAIAAVQGDRVRVVDDSGRPTATSTRRWRHIASGSPPLPNAAACAALRGSSVCLTISFRWSCRPIRKTAWGDYPQFQCRNAFFFTNALGLVSIEQAHRLAAVLANFPKARWIVALHHHLVEYPMPVATFAERVGTALINGSWFVRKLNLSRREFSSRTAIATSTGLVHAVR